MQRLDSSFSSLSVLDYETCVLAKHHRRSYVSRTNNRAVTPFDLVHYDVWRPCPTIAILRYRYFVTFVDDFSHLTWIYLIKERSELFDIFCHFTAKTMTQIFKTVNILRSDNAREYFTILFTSYMATHEMLR
jgi:hypothetical protein